jgi:hypothetical protein
MSLQERISDITRALGHSLYEQVLEYNRLDLELYEYACNVFKQRWRRQRTLGLLIRRAEAGLRKIIGGRAR